MSVEITTFDPTSIQTACDRNLATGLRMVADALDAGLMDGKCISVRGHGFTPSHDQRAHVMLKVDLAAPVFTRREMFSGDLLNGEAVHVFDEIKRDAR